MKRYAQSALKFLAVMMIWLAFFVFMTDALDRELELNEKNNKMYLEGYGYGDE